METVHIDVSKKAVGRAASEIARFLQGKHRPDWRPHKVSPVRVVVTNTDGVSFTGKKFLQKKLAKFAKIQKVFLATIGW